LALMFFHWEKCRWSIFDGIRKKPKFTCFYCCGKGSLYM